LDNEPPRLNPDALYGSERVMKKSILFTLTVRVCVLLCLSIAMGFIAVLPLPCYFLPVATVLFYPVAWACQAVGQRELLFISPDASMFEAAFTVARLTFPFYLVVSFIPQVARWLTCRVRQLTSRCLVTPIPFTVYFVTGGLLGTLLGLHAWAESTCAGSAWGLFLMASGTTIVVGWCSAVLRCLVVSNAG
jgi:hypothetical protein